MKNNYKNLLVAASLIFGASTIGNAQETTFDYTGSVQTYTVPAEIYSIELTGIGAAGGDGGDGEAGKGAQMSGVFAVEPGQVLNIVVAEAGESGTFAGGGGGGTFVWDADGGFLLMAAGGGGGGGHTDAASGNEDGMDASITEDGTNGNGFSDGRGTAGYGGTTPTSITYAGGGAGLYSNGSNGTYHGCYQHCTGGLTLIVGEALGGQGGGDFSYIANGGYGGGGGANGRCVVVGGGGGGGFSGGGAGGEIIDNVYNGGGGGGSYNGGGSQDNTAGVGTGNGQVIINPICNPIVIDFTTIDETFDGNGAIDISVSGGNGAFSYDWDTDGTGDFDDSEDLIGLTGGTYTVVVRDASACPDEAITIELNSQLSIATSTINIGVYPNPTSNMISITQHGTFEYEILNINGQRMIAGTGIENQEVSLQDFPNGTYIVNITVGTEVESVRVVKQ